MKKSRTTVDTKKAKIAPIQRIESDSPEKELGEDNYSVEDVIDKMLARKDRKIPGSVYKPHAPMIMLFQSVALDQPQASARVFFVYPKYCFNPIESKSKELAVKGVTSEAMRPNALSFLECKEWHKSPLLRQFQSVKAAPQDYFRAHAMTMGFKITESTHVYNSVVNVFKASGVRIVSPGTARWNVMWTGIVKNDYLRDATKYQKINHYP